MLLIKIARHIQKNTNVLKINGYYLFILKDDSGKLLMQKLIECYFKMGDQEPSERGK